MLTSVIGTELAKILLSKASEVKLEDAVKLLDSLKRGSRGGALLVPGLGALGVGVAVGAGIGMLMAPRSGAETRAALRDSVRDRLNALKNKLGQAPNRVEEVEAREPNAGAAAPNEPRTRSN
ncbi:MAG TPA: YtxH domain-containing protein [Polyangiaceae bacterium]